MTPPPPAKPSSTPSTYHMGLPSTSTTCGTRSLYLAGARLVQRSWDSVRWVSASTTRSPSSARAIRASPCFETPMPRILHFDVDVEEQTMASDTAVPPRGMGDGDSAQRVRGNPRSISLVE